MKISTARNLLLALDVALFTGVVGVAYQEIESKKERRDARQDYRRDLEIQLDDLEKAGTPVKRDGPEPYTNHGVPLVPVEKKVVTKKTETETKPKEEPRTPIADMLEVHGILAGGDPSMAFIIPKGAAKASDEAKQNTGFYLENEVIEWAQGAVISKIEPDKVTFELKGQTESIQVLAGEVGGSSASKKSARGSSKPRSAPVVVTPAVLRNPAGMVNWSKGSSRVTLTKTGVAAASQYGEDVIKGVTWSRFRLADGKEAVRVDKIPNSSVLRSGGMQEGDAIHSINGQRVRSKAEIVSYVRNNPNMRQYRVRIFRNGRLITRTVTPER